MTRAMRICSVLLCVAFCSATSCRADTPQTTTAPAQSGESDLQRVFRFQAMGQAAFMVKGVAVYDIGDDARRELTQIVHEHLARVDQQVAQLPDRGKDASNAAALQRADELAQQFERDKLLPWLKAHDAEAKVIERQTDLANKIVVLLASGPDGLLTALRDVQPEADNYESAHRILQAAQREAVALQEANWKNTDAARRLADPDARLLAERLAGADIQSKVFGEMQWALVEQLRTSLGPKAWAAFAVEVDNLPV